jgi:DNA-directed RNA polymerase subunit RPC12/RpoP
MPSCPNCGAEVEYFTRRKNSPFARCPACGRTFKVKEHPELAPYVRVEEPVEQEDQEEASEEVEEQTEVQPVVQARPRPQPETKPRPRPSREPPKLFEEPKPVEEIVTETLLEWGCDENFVKGIVSYIQSKGVFDPGWLFNILLKGRTGRRFTEAEAWMVVDIITSRIQQEKQKAEALGRPYFGGVTVTAWSPTPQQYPYATPIPVQTSYPTYHQPTYHPTSSTPPTSPVTQPNPQPAYTPHPTTTITPERLQEMIRQALAEQRKASEMDELRKGIFELEKKLIEQRQQFEKQVSDLRAEVLNVVKETLKETLSAIPQAQPQPQQPQQPQISPEKVDLVKAELEKTYMQRLHEVEKSFEQRLAEVRQSYEQRLAEIKGAYEKQLAELKEKLSEAERKELLNKIAQLEEKIEQYRRESSKAPVSPEGWQTDEARLVAELGHKFLDLVRERKPMEYLVKIVPQLPKAREAKTEESLEEMIKSLGGEVE